MTRQPTLRTERLLLRPLRYDDTEAFAAMNADARVMQHYPATLDREESDRLLTRLHQHVDARGYGMWAMELPGEAPFIGFVGFNHAELDAPFTPCVEIGWRVVAAQWNRGYATEGARAALDHAFDELGLDRVLAWTTRENLPSLRVMEKLGMRRAPELDFEHPRIPRGHRLRPHVVYEMTASRRPSA